MSQKAYRIAQMVGLPKADGINPYFLGFIERFNRGEFYEAHDVLEQLWLADRHGANGAFFKGLIQLAGAFVHLQKNRLRPSDALFKLAAANISQYSGVHHHLHVGTVLKLIADWRALLDRGAYELNPLPSQPAPNLEIV